MWKQPQKYVNSIRKKQGVRKLNEDKQSKICVCLYTKYDVVEYICLCSVLHNVMYVKSEAIWGFKFGFLKLPSNLRMVYPLTLSLNSQIIYIFLYCDVGMLIVDVAVITYVILTFMGWIYLSRQCYTIVITVNLFFFLNFLLINCYFSDETELFRQTM